jgi:hypothetical protein
MSTQQQTPDPIQRTEFPKTVIQLRRDTEDKWDLSNPTLMDGEVGLVSNGGYTAMKVGDGVTPWKDLSFFSTGEGTETEPAAYESVTYEQLLEKVNSGTLKIKGLYKLTDHQTIHRIPYDEEIVVAPIEVLYLQADEANRLNPYAYSVDHPMDTIVYDIKDRWVTGIGEYKEYWDGAEPGVGPGAWTAGPDYIELDGGFDMTKPIYFDISWGDNHWGGFRKNNRYQDDDQWGDLNYKYSIVGNRIYIVGVETPLTMENINYFYTEGTIGAITLRKGNITYRRDIKNNLEAHYDWRNVKFKRYFLAAPNHVEGQYYNVGDIVTDWEKKDFNGGRAADDGKDGRMMYRCVKAGVYNPGQIVWESSSGSWGWGQTAVWPWVAIGGSGYSYINNGSQAPIGTPDLTKSELFHTFAGQRDSNKQLDGSTGGIRDISIGKGNADGTGLNNIVIVTQTWKSYIVHILSGPGGPGGIEERFEGLDSSNDIQGIRFGTGSKDCHLGAYTKRELKYLEFPENSYNNYTLHGLSNVKVKGKFNGNFILGSMTDCMFDALSDNVFLSTVLDSSISEMFNCNIKGTIYFSTAIGDWYDVTVQNGLSSSVFTGNMSSVNIKASITGSHLSGTMSGVTFNDSVQNSKIIGDINNTTLNKIDKSLILGNISNSTIGSLMSSQISRQVETTTISGQSFECVYNTPLKSLTVTGITGKTIQTVVGGKLCHYEADGSNTIKLIVNEF